MSPEPDAEQLSCNVYKEAQSEIDTIAVENANNRKTSTTASETCYQTECSLPRKQRECRNKSPIAISTLLETFAAPLSPASSSCTSQGNSSADATFEPSVDMMVNDFDDEQTLNEEEALAAMEEQDPHDEIATLQEESEMPLEELLAKYQVAPPVPVFAGVVRKKKNKRTSGGSKHSKHRKIDAETTATNVDNPEHSTVGTMTAVHDSERNFEETRKDNDTLSARNVYDENEESLEEPDIDNSTEGIVNSKDLLVEQVENTKPRRTHLMDLYPEESFTEVLNFDNKGDYDKQLDHLYNEDDEAADVNEVEEEDEFDSDYVKKTIMVGPSYQATIPDGLSQYGDVLPYENEDKLIWEPSQVSERQVEEYLLKARDIKPCLLDNVDEDGEDSNQTNIATSVTIDAALFTPNENKETNAKNTDNLQRTISSLTAGENGDGPAVIKDNEQALHLLVQCGYDFKEALRRKRLNALPLTGSMSLWSEEECHKFEEGIQKFGKDFLKIRQNQVRTRTMRELVQFYYLWKKSDRRDHNFANSDTVDHMDIYLNEGGEYNPTTTVNGVVTTGSTTTNGTSTLVIRKNNVCIQKSSISIMMTGSSTSPSNSSAAAASPSSTSASTSLTTTTTTTTPSTQLNSCCNKAANNRKRSVVGVSGSNYDNALPQGIPPSATQMK